VAASRSKGERRRSRDDLGTSIEYTVAEITGRKVGVVAKILERS
jgi:hypothetical protein